MSMAGHPNGRIGAGLRRPTRNQRTCRRNKTPALPLEPHRNSCPYRPASHAGLMSAAHSGKFVRTDFTKTGFAATLRRNPHLHLSYSPICCLRFEAAQDALELLPLKAPPTASVGGGRLPAFDGTKKFGRPFAVS
jgi:hypothetical protein